MTQQNPSAPAGALINAAEPSDLAVAIELGHRMLATPNDAGVREALRILIRAAEDEAARHSVDPSFAEEFPAIAAFLADERGERA
ncbi:hypothetical protein [Streptomyces sp. 2A115]|uniref:hypothetical protein n=1 Tax=Streptomyces sp. 2A115 TaxID=3457439 RepID=UPI003FD0C65C